MSLRRLTFLFFFFGLLSFEAANAQNVQWNQPEVVPEELARQNRRVLRFSGVSKPGTQVRIRDNKVKMIFSRKNVRWARIPQKHRVQFPVIASDTGYLSFDLYLPTTAVEIPLEIFRNGKWMPYRFSFDVPESGKASDFQYAEESYKTIRDEEKMVVEDFLAEYDKKKDVGQVVSRGDSNDEWKSWVTGKFIVWGNLGLTYYNSTQSLSPGGDLGTFSGASFPAWEVGGEYRWNSKWKAELSYINRAADASADGNYTLQNSEFNWTQFNAMATYYPVSLEKEKYRLGLKAGVQMHDLPYSKQVQLTAFRIFNNSVTFIALGGNYETMATQGWNLDINALFLYPIMSDDNFDVDSAYGFNANVALFKEVIPALYMGGKLDFHWMNLETTHNSIVTLGTRVNSDLSLWQLTPSFLIRAEF